MLTNRRTGPISEPSPVSRNNLPFSGAGGLLSTNWISLCNVHVISPGVVGARYLDIIHTVLKLWCPVDVYTVFVYIYIYIAVYIYIYIYVCVCVCLTHGQYIFVTAIEAAIGLFCFKLFVSNWDVDRQWWQLRQPAINWNEHWCAEVHWDYETKVRIRSVEFLISMSWYR